MGRWPTLSITRDERGKTLRLDLPLGSIEWQRREGSPRAIAWVSLWGWLFLSAVTVDLLKFCVWLLIVNWRNAIPIDESRVTDAYLIGACIFICASPLLLCVTLGATFRAWRELFPKPAPKPWVLPDTSWFDDPPRDDPDDEPPEGKGCGVPVGPRHPAPLRAHARRELACVA